MPIVTLGEGISHSFEDAVQVRAAIKQLQPAALKSAIAAKVNDRLVDLSYLIIHDAHIELISGKNPEGLEVIRHSTAHLLAHAVKQLFPSAQVTIGPVIENGFYYDFAYERPFTPEDLTAIEEQMRKLAKADIPVSRQIMDRKQAIEFFKSKGEHYKAQIIQDIPADEAITLYAQDDFVDLCRGPHVPSTGCLRAFKLSKLAGAYWRGDSKNEMLQRIYGTAWATTDDLNAYLKQLEEAERRDHRKIAKTMDLFHTQEEAPGMIFWHPNGWTLYQVLEQYVRKVFLENGYREVRTPQIVDRSLWERSGHWDVFGEKNMFTTQSEHRDFAIKPMNCPCHIQIYNRNLHSYRELPIRLAEFGSCHRNEASGTLHGLLRVRNFVQDDAHIFCTEDQIQMEVARFIDLLYSVYDHFGFTNVQVQLSTRPEQRIGSDEIWDKAESALAGALDEKGIAWIKLPGEGAFYGPKIQFSLVDCLGRLWQCGTMQVDFFMPDRLGASYIAEDGQKKIPVMLHRAILGSLERFVGILLEHYADALPTWLAPVQVVVMNISDAQREFALQLTDLLQKNDIRAKCDLRNEKIGFKIREHTMTRIPYLLVVGDREVAQNQVAVRTQKGKDLGTMSTASFVDFLQSEIVQRGSILTKE